MPYTSTAKKVELAAVEAPRSNTEEKIFSYDDSWVETAPEPLRDEDDGMFLLSHDKASDSEVAQDSDVQHSDTTYPVKESHGDEAGQRTRVVGFPRLPRLPPARETFHALQEWEGVITDTSGEEFQASLKDVTADTSSGQEEATFPIAEVSEEDLDKIRDGSVFRWVIGYRRLAMGQKQRISHIVFRDLPVLTKDDLRRGSQWAAAIRRALDAQPAQ